MASDFCYINQWQGVKCRKEKEMLYGEWTPATRTNLPAKIAFGDCP
jgi:hypothetical protein